MRNMKRCICEGNKALRELEKVREIALKAAKMDNSMYIIYRNEEIYYFCREGEKFPGTLVEYVLP